MQSYTLLVSEAQFNMMDKLKSSLSDSKSNVKKTFEAYKSFGDSLVQSLEPAVDTLDSLDKQLTDFLQAVDSCGHSSDSKESAAFVPTLTKLKENVESTSKHFVSIVKRLKKHEGDIQSLEKRFIERLGATVACDGPVIPKLLRNSISVITKLSEINLEVLSRSTAEIAVKIAPSRKPIAKPIIVPLTPAKNANASTNASASFLELGVVPDKQQQQSLVPVSVFWFAHCCYRY